MIPCAVIALWQRNWRLEVSLKGVVQGCLVGFLGAGGQLALFEALIHVPPYIAFPIVSLYPVLTVLLSITLLGEQASRRQWIGIAVALPAIGLLSLPLETPTAAAPAVSSGVRAEASSAIDEPLQPPGIAETVVNQPKSPEKFKYIWLLLTVLVFAAWGLQAYFMKTATKLMSAEGLFVYMALTGVLLAPIAAAMTTLDKPIEWNPLAGWGSVWTVAAIQVLNAIGALTLVHAMRTGKAMIVAPLTSLAPLITILISLADHHQKPSMPHAIGMILAMVAIYLFAE
jgi:drug/metabolite transporter (DMT)-like permease